MPPSQKVSWSDFLPLKLPRSTVSAVFVKWKRLGATTAQQQSGTSHKLTERGRRVLKHVVRKNHLSSIATLTTEFQTASRITSAQELYVGRFMKLIWATAYKPKIAMRNDKRWLEWCKVRRHWTLEQWKRVLWSDKSYFAT